MKKAMKKQRQTNENNMNFHCKFMRFYLVVHVQVFIYLFFHRFGFYKQSKCHQCHKVCITNIDSQTS